MIIRFFALALFAFLVCACQDATSGLSTPSGPSPTTLMSASAASLAASAPAPSSMSGERPWKAKLVWTVTGIEWAGEPGRATSTFGGRCSVASDYVISAGFRGEATHAGKVTGTTGHCSQISWSNGAPAGATYSDGRGTCVSANGSTIILRYGNGTTGFDPAANELWFRDDWTFIGGTGLFEGATGSGEEGGHFVDFMALLAGAPVQMWMEGSITYSPSGK